METTAALVAGLIGLGGVVVGIIGSAIINWLRANREDRRLLEKEKRVVYASVLQSCYYWEPIEKLPDAESRKAVELMFASVTQVHLFAGKNVFQAFERFQRLFVPGQGGEVTRVAKAESYKALVREMRTELNIKPPG